MGDLGRFTGLAVLQFFGMPVVDLVIGYGQGPGEVLLDKDACNRASRGGEALSRGETAFRGLA